MQPEPADNERESLLNAIKAAVATHAGARLTRQQFIKDSGFKVGDIFRYFPKWSDALTAAGIEVDPYNQRIPAEDLLVDWGQLCRTLKRIPTRNEYKLEGSYSPGSFERNFGPWTSVPSAFRLLAQNRTEWSDVLEFIPLEPTPRKESAPVQRTNNSSIQNLKLSDRPTYGDPIDFRGLRHAPVNESGVVLLFGIVARELGYLVEAVQAGFPDCEAKRQIAPGKWQRVRIEFEFESRNFLEHGHRADGCDLIICWRHNWADCPENLEIVELSSVIRTLPKSDE